MVEGSNHVAVINDGVYFFYFWPKILLQGNLCLKTKIVSLRQNLITRSTPIWRIQWSCSFLGVWSKIKKCQCKLKFCISTNSNLQNSNVGVHLLIVRVEILYWGKFIANNQNCSSSWSLVPRLIWIGIS